MNWTALVPVKAPAARKLRLAEVLSAEARLRLSGLMLDHVLAILSRSVGKTIVLSPEAPDGWSGPLIIDRGRGLNEELADAAETLEASPLLIIHADLPLLSAGDIAALLDAGEDSIAIAPDRHEHGTNALAISRGNFAFAFGPDSFHRHCEAAGGEARIVRRQGLAFDIDTLGDLAAARALGVTL